MLAVKENGRLSDERSRTTSVWIASFVFFLAIPLFPFVVVVVVSPATPPLPLLRLLLLVPQKSKSSNGGPDERRSFTHPEHQGNSNKLTTNKRSNFTFTTKWQGDLLFGTYIRERITEHHLSVCLSVFLSFFPARLLQDFVQEKLSLCCCCCCCYCRRLQPASL
jgi:hypothetical protein